MKNQCFTRLMQICMIFWFSQQWLNAATFYWVNGSGNWTDYAQHWATTSGGNTFHNRVPLANDDVVFDSLSFTGSGQVVTVDDIWSSCLSMDWSGVRHVPTLESGSNGVTLKIYGSLALVDSMILNYRGHLVFESEAAGNTIRTAGQMLTSSLVFEGRGGEWSLLDDIRGFSYSNLGIVATAGTFRTNGHRLNTPLFISAGNLPRHIDLGNSLIQVGEGYAEGKWHFAGDSIYFDAGTSKIIFTGDQKAFFNGSSLNYHKVFFQSPLTQVTGSNTYLDSLLISPGVQLSFGSNHHQYLQGAFVAEGNCYQGIILRSIHAGPAYLHKSSGSFQGNHLHLNSIHAEVGNPLIAFNSIDGGGNTHCVVIPKVPQNFYWINGGGNWSDTLHWSFIPGGPPAGCLPTSVDNVFFNAQSFTGSGQSVQVDLSTAECRSMDWTGALYHPTLIDVANPNLHIYGSLTLIPQMLWNFKGGLFFQSNQNGNTITSAGQIFTCPLQFMMIGGEWELLDDIQGFLPERHGIRLNAGTLRTNGHSVRAGSFSTGNTAGTQLFLGSSQMLIGPGRFPYPTWSIGQVHFDAGTSTIHLLGPQSGHNFEGSHTYHKLIAHGEKLFINGNNTFNDSLIIPGGSLLILKDHCSQDLKGGLWGSGNCMEQTRIESSTLGQPSNLVKNTGSIRLDHVFLQDIHASGGANFEAYQAVDGSRNQGWTMQTFPPRDFYWIGGSGDWEDGQHWSLNDSGSPLGCLPTQIDDVHFTANSFTGPNETVTVGQNASVCHDLDWTGATGTPNLDGNGHLKIYGSMQLIPDMTVDLGVNFIFQASDTGHTVLTAGHRPWSVDFFGLGGGWSLLDDVNLAYALRLNAGNLHTHGVSIVTSRFLSGGNYRRQLFLDSSRIEVGPNLFSSWQLGGDSLIFDAGSSKIYVNGGLPGNNGAFVGGDQIYHEAYFRASYSSIAGNNSFEKLSLSPGIRVRFASGSTQHLRGYFDAVGLPSRPIEIRASQDGNAAYLRKDSGEVCAQYLELTDNHTLGNASFKAGNSVDVNNNAGWLFQGCTPLPTDQLSFFVEVKGQEVLTAWTTTSDIPLSHFEVQRSNTGKDFQTLGRVMAHERPEAREGYSFTDLNPLLSGYSYYRLKQVDHNGQVQYSEIVAISFEEQYTLLTSPNPFGDQLKIMVGGKVGQQTKFSLCDLLGRKLDGYTSTVMPGIPLLLSTVSLKPGSYLLIVEDAKGHRKIKKVIKL